MPKIAILIFSFIAILLVALVILLVIASKMNRNETRKLKMLVAKNTNKSKGMGTLLLKLYPAMSIMPGVKKVLAKANKRMRIVHIGEPRKIRERTVVHTLWVLAVLIGSVVLAILLSDKLYARAAIIMSGFFMMSLIENSMVRKIDKKLLRDQVDFMSILKHEYHQSKMVVTSIERASLVTKGPMAAHARRIHEILTSLDPEDELSKYYDEAPNDHLKKLAGISYLVYQFGDVEHEDSIFIDGLSKIAEDVRIEIMKREEIDYALQGGLIVIAASVFFLDPIRSWAEGTFDGVAEFYSSKAGIYSIAAIYFTIAASFIGFRMLREFDTGDVAKDEGKILERLLKVGWIKALVGRVVPGDKDSLKSTKMLMTSEKLLRDTNSTISVKQLYLKRMLFFSVSFVVGLSIVIAGHLVDKSNVISIPDLDETRLVQSQMEIKQAEVERSIVLKYEGIAYSEEQLKELITIDIRESNIRPSGESFEEYLDMVIGKIEKYESSYLKWNEVFVVFLLSLAMYWVPIIILAFKAKIRKDEMQNEVDAFYTIVGLLRRVPRIMVSEILEWMYRYSMVFKSPLSRAMMDFSSGPWQSLEKLKIESKFVPLERIVDKLQVAVSDIPVKEAFEDIDQERSFSLEERRFANKKIVESRKLFGRGFAFAPSVVILVLYLLVPFGLVMFEEFGGIRDILGGL